MEFIMSLNFVGHGFNDYLGNPYIVMKEKISMSDGLLIDLGTSISTSLMMCAYYSRRAINSYTYKEQVEKELGSLLNRMLGLPMLKQGAVLGFVLSPALMNERIGGMLISDFLWQELEILSFMSLHDELMPIINGVRKAKEVSEAEALLGLAVKNKVYSLTSTIEIHDNNETGISEAISHLFHLTDNAFSVGMTPLLDIKVCVSPDDKCHAEKNILKQVLSELDIIGDAKVILTLSTPDIEGFYDEISYHPNVEKAFIRSLSAQWPDCSRASQDFRQNQAFSGCVGIDTLSNLKVNAVDSAFLSSFRDNLNGLHRATKFSLDK
jgi:fructose-bisphosphate aldolase class I